MHEKREDTQHKIHEKKNYLRTTGLITIPAVWRENQLILFDLYYYMIFIICVIRSQDGGSEELPWHTSTSREDTPLFPDRRLYRTAEGRSRHHVVGGTSVFYLYINYVLFCHENAKELNHNNHIFINPEKFINLIMSNNEKWLEFHSFIAVHTRKDTQPAVTFPSLKSIKTQSLHLSVAQMHWPLQEVTLDG